MKKSKILMPALGMLLLSTAASVTGTVAWFSANSTVSATGMQIKAKAEDGILISNETADASAEWKETAQASHNSVAELYPTSTKTGATWVHNVSSDSSKQDAAGEYTTVAAKFDTAAGIGHDYAGTENATYDADTEKAYYLMNNFYIKSSSNSLTTALIIKDVTATVAASGTTPSTDLDKALRVLVVFDGDFAAKSYLYAPFYGASLSYHVAVAAGAKGTNQTAVAPTPCYTTTAGDVPAGTHVEVNTTTTVTNIPANTAVKDPDGTVKAIKASVYLFFEGEDANCKSDNIKETLDTLQVSVSFGI